MHEGVVTRIADLARESTRAYTVNGRHLLVHNGTIIDERLESHPGPNAPLVFHTLRGLRDYVMEDHDGLPAGGFSVQVVSPMCVVVVGSLLEDTGQRFVYAKAEGYDRLKAVSGFSFGQWMSNEQAIIGLHAVFEATEDRDKLLRILSNVTQSVVRQDEDTGVGQNVTVRQGIALEAEATIPSPAILAPYRTFVDVAQPRSAFIVRARSSSRDGEQPTVAFFEADGGAWRDAATEAIRAWLKEQLGDVVPVLA